jgi:hypothetical protein
MGFPELGIPAAAGDAGSIPQESAAAQLKSCAPKPLDYYLLFQTENAKLGGWETIRFAIAMCLFSLIDQQFSAKGYNVLLNIKIRECWNDGMEKN